MSTIRRVLPLVTALALVASGVVAAPFETGLDFQKFTGKVFGSFENDGKARKACICEQAGGIFNAAGYVDLVHDPATDYFKVRCLAPHPFTPDGQIFAVAICPTSFEIIH